MWRVPAISLTRVLGNVFLELRDRGKREEETDTRISTTDLGSNIQAAGCIFMIHLTLQTAAATRSSLAPRSSQVVMQAASSRSVLGERGDNDFVDLRRE